MISGFGQELNIQWVMMENSGIRQEKLSTGIIITGMIRLIIVIQQEYKDNWKEKDKEKE